MTPLGAILRLEHGLGGFEEEQRQYRWRLDEAERRLSSYQSRIGGAFQFGDELGAKKKQLREIEEELAASAIAGFLPGLHSSRGIDEGSRVETCNFSTSSMSDDHFPFR